MGVALALQALMAILSGVVELIAGVLKGAPKPAPQPQPVAPPAQPGLPQPQPVPVRPTVPTQPVAPVIPLRPRRVTPAERPGRLAAKFEDGVSQASLLETGDNKSSAECADDSGTIREANLEDGSIALSSMQGAEGGIVQTARKDKIDPDACKPKAKKPLWWNPNMRLGTAGFPGTLDSRNRAQAVGPLHGHHVWPWYVGGPEVQPLMSIRGTVHNQVIHTNASLHGVLKATALTIGRGFNITTNRTHPENVAFRRHLVANVGDRTTVSVSLSAYYAGLNLITSPPIPAPAYMLGITHSFPRIS